VILFAMAAVAIAVVLVALGAPERGGALAAKPAAISGAPTIGWGTPIGHADRGPCTTCHRLVSHEGERLPAISALSPLPHEFRGVCNNCHAIEASWLLRFFPASTLPNRAGPNAGLGSLLARAILGLGSEHE
jgi:hypothetical protein